jgi:hypothetical protein
MLRNISVILFLFAIISAQGQTGTIKVKKKPCNCSHTVPVNVNDIPTTPSDSTNAGIKGRILESVTKKPVAGADVWISTSDGKSYFLKSDGKGYYTINFIKSGRCWIQVYANCMLSIINYTSIPVLVKEKTLEYDIILYDCEAYQKHLLEKGK